MKIFTAYWKCYTDDYYAAYNRQMFITREDADKFLDDLLDYEQVERYYVLEETVHEEFVPTNLIDEDEYPDEDEI